MAPCETRYGLLVRLAWELRAVPVTTVLVLPYHAEPVLFVPRWDGRREPVLAVRRTERWLLIWRGHEIEADRLGALARRIAWDAA
ncbi:hypothetical protein [Actinomadura vinacea]